MRHETKISVLNFKMIRTYEDQSVVQSKELYEFHCGFRRMLARPLFSEYNAVPNYAYPCSTLSISGIYALSDMTHTLLPRFLDRSSTRLHRSACSANVGLTNLTWFQAERSIHWIRKESCSSAFCSPDIHSKSIVAEPLSDSCSLTRRTSVTTSR